VINPIGEVKRVSEQILERILRGSYAPGVRLPSEAALAGELGCGRSTVREALRHLADLGLVRSVRGSGAHVLDYRRDGTPGLMPTYLRVGRFDTDPRKLAAEMLRMRRLMASEAVRLAARYAKPADLAEARARLEDARRLESDPGAHALNELELYRALVLASGMWPAVWMVNAFWAPLREINAWFAPVMGPVVDAEFQPTMERLLGLIGEGQEHAAVGLVSDWFERVDARLLERIERVLDRLAALSTRSTAPRSPVAKSPAAATAAPSGAPSGERREPS
jgi:DNA-binding FadR family transcriptional regulator